MKLKLSHENEDAGSSPDKLKLVSGLALVSGCWLISKSTPISMITLQTPFPTLSPPSFHLILCKIPNSESTAYHFSPPVLSHLAHLDISPNHAKDIIINSWFSIRLSLQYPSIFLISSPSLPPQLLFQVLKLTSNPLHNFKIIWDDILSLSWFRTREPC